MARSPKVRNSEGQKSEVQRSRWPKDQMIIWSYICYKTNSEKKAVANATTLTSSLLGSTRVQFLYPQAVLIFLFWAWAFSSTKKEIHLQNFWLRGSSDTFSLE